MTQACHALRQFVADHPDEDRRWFETTNLLVILGARDAAALADLGAQARARGISVATFREPDLGNALTAIALAPSIRSKRLCRGLPLSLASPSGRDGPTPL
jgi:hypothetical protein